MIESAMPSARYLSVLLLAGSALFSAAHAEGVTAMPESGAGHAGGNASVAASSEAEKQAYCRNVQDSAEAEDLLDTGLNGYGRLGQSDTNPELKQAVVGVSKSLSRHLQGNSALRAAVLECQLYGRSLDVEHIVKYRMALIDKQVAERQAFELKNLLHLMDVEIDAAQQRRKAGDATLGDVMALTQQRVQIYNQYVAARNSAMPSIPEVPAIDVEQAMRQVDDLTRDLQEELNHKQALQAWDLQLIAGVQKPVLGSAGSGTSQGTAPFVSLTFTYNLNARAYEHKLADSVESLMELRRQQNDGLTVQVQNLQKNIADNLALQKDLLAQISPEIDRLNTDFRRLGGLQSPEAAKMITQIRISLATAMMEQRLARFRVQLLSAGDHAPGP